MTICAEFLKELRKQLGLKKGQDTIDKRYKPYLAPDDLYYNDHCGHCAEVQYLNKKYYTVAENRREGK